MQHFSEQVWADYVRGIALPDAMRKVEAHVASGCPECSSDSGLWSRLGRLASNDKNYAPADGLVRLVKLEFAGKGVAPAEEWASLIFDSLNQPLPIGIRCGVFGARQVLYEAEGLTIDLRFEHKTNSNTVHVSGQILSTDAPRCWVAGATVVLWNDQGRMVTTTESSHYGEFQLEFEAQDNLRVSIASVGRKTLRIPLGSFNS